MFPVGTGMKMIEKSASQCFRMEKDKELSHTSERYSWKITMISIVKGEND